MKRPAAIAAVLFLVLAAPARAGETKAIFRPVEGAKLERVESYNAWQLHQGLYFSSRHRVVAVDVDPLLEEQNVIFNLFEDLDVQFETVHVDRDARLRLWHWTGIPVERANSVRTQAPAEFERSGPYSTIDGTLKRLAQGLDINSFSVHRDTGRAIAYGSEPQAALMQMHPGESTTGNLAGWNRDAFRTLWGTITLPPPALTRFMIRPLRNSPRYHVVYEIDEDRWFVPPEYPHDMSVSAREARAKNDEYNSYLRSFGEPENRMVVGEIE